MTYKNNAPFAGGRNKKTLQPNHIKERINPVEFYAHRVSKSSAARRGSVDGGLCPFHADNKPGSFKINLRSGAFKCFSCGTSGGDIIAFTMLLYELSFPEALAKLANDWGISLC